MLLGELRRIANAESRGVRQVMPRSKRNCEASQKRNGGSGRARTDDIHGVNVALYQLSYRSAVENNTARQSKSAN